MARKQLVNDALIGVGETTPIDEQSYEKRIELRIEELVPHPNNDLIYSQYRDREHIVELANDIDLHGLIERIIVMKNPNGLDNYMIVSGHRRWEALKLLVNERGQSKYRKIKCLVRQFGSFEESVLFLISCNSTQRRMSNYLLYMQAKVAIETIETMRRKDDPQVKNKRTNDILSEMMRIGSSNAFLLMNVESVLDDVLMDQFKKGFMTFNMINKIKEMNDECKLQLSDEIRRQKRDWDSLEANRTHVYYYSKLSENESPIEQIDKQPKKQHSEIGLRKTKLGYVTPTKVKQSILRFLNKLKIEIQNEQSIDKVYVEKIDELISIVDKTINI